MGFVTDHFGFCNKGFFQFRFFCILFKSLALFQGFCFRQGKTPHLEADAVPFDGRRENPVNHNPASAAVIPSAKMTGKLSAKPFQFLFQVFPGARGFFFGCSCCEFIKEVLKLPIFSQLCGKFCESVREEFDFLQSLFLNGIDESFISAKVNLETCMFFRGKQIFTFICLTHG